MNGNVNIANVGGYDFTNCWPSQLVIPSSGDSAFLLVGRLRTRLADIQRQLNDVAKLQEEAAAISRMLEAYDGK